VASVLYVVNLFSVQVMVLRKFLAMLKGKNIKTLQKSGLGKDRSISSKYRPVAKVVYRLEVTV